MRFRIVISVIIGLSFLYSGYGQENTIQYHPTKVWLKIEKNGLSVESILQKAEIEVPYTQPFPKTPVRHISNPQMVDISAIYLLNFTNTKELEYAIRKLNNLSEVVYVERKKIHQLDLVVNDPKISDQSYLNQIKASQAWDISTGLASIKIGVVDSGTDLDHPDLGTQLSQNTGDPINGVDDDNDGYIDNFNGWDFIDDDHLPESVASSHGIHVAGIAAAATNNNIGVASLGFQTQYMPIRAANGSDVEYGYEGIVYAAEMGCDIINCSWGAFGYSKFEEDIVNYATFNHNALIVGAAGNSGFDIPYYPAAYENALAVASVNNSDGKSTFTNYGYWVDIASPGENIYSTYKNDGYNYNTGTSMSAPMVSAAAALVKATYSGLQAMQIGERVKSTTDNISSVNPGFENKIGTGRLNAFEAINGSITNASVVFWDIDVTNKKDNVFVSGDTVDVSGLFTNYLEVSGAVTATATTTSTHLSILNSTSNLGVFQSLEQKNNSINPFRFAINSATPENSSHDIKITVSDGQFTNVYFVVLKVNEDYLNLDVNKVSTSVTSKGVFGYNDNFQAEGLGFRFKSGSSQLYEGGLMIGAQFGSAYKVVDRIRNSSVSWDSDLSSSENVSYQTVPDSGNQMIIGVFNDSTATLDSIGIWVRHESYAYTTPGHDQYVVLQYHIVNQSSMVIDSLSVGLFTDFDIGNYAKNRVGTEELKFLSYTYSFDLADAFYGVQVLNTTHFRSYGLDNVAGGNGGITIIDGYPSSEKLASMKNNRLDAGYFTPEGNDVANVTSATNIQLGVNDTVKVAFAVHAADNLEELIQSADSAYRKYNGKLPTGITKIISKSNGFQVYPNPGNGMVQYKFTENYNGKAQLRVINLAGKIMMSQTLNSGPGSLDLTSFLEGVYFIEVEIESNYYIQKFVKIN